MLDASSTGASYLETLMRYSAELKSRALTRQEVEEIVSVGYAQTLVGLSIMVNENSCSDIIRTRKYIGF